MSNQQANQNQSATYNVSAYQDNAGMTEIKRNDDGTVINKENEKYTDPFKEYDQDKITMIDIAALDKRHTSDEAMKREMLINEQVLRLADDFLKNNPEYADKLDIQEIQKQVVQGHKENPNANSILVAENVNQILEQQYQVDAEKLQHPKPSFNM